MELIDKNQAIEIVRDKCKRVPTCAILAMDAIDKLPVLQKNKIGLRSMRVFQTGWDTISHLTNTIMSVMTFLTEIILKRRKCIITR